MMEDAMNSNEDYNDSEKEHFCKIVHAFKSYRGYSQSVVMKRLSYMETLPPIQQRALKTYKSTLEQVLNCIDANNKIIELVTEDVEKLFENVQNASATQKQPLQINVSDVEKVQVTLKQIYRDWSQDGIIERIQAYQPILDELESRFPRNSPRCDDVAIWGKKRATRGAFYNIARLKGFHHEQLEKLGTSSPSIGKTSMFNKVSKPYLAHIREDGRSGSIVLKAPERCLPCYHGRLYTILSFFPEVIIKKWGREDINVLVPGAGLGRLAFEIAKLGFSCQGNEFSLFMLFASNFILNRCAGVDLYRIFPWTQSCDNNLSPEDMVRSVAFPDVDPSVLHKINAGRTRFTMVAGDFLEVYVTNDEWDCIATCFFIDCASNIFTFIEHIYRILKPGGVWINLGPLQYHFSSASDEFSIEPSFEDVKTIIKSVGFHLQQESTKHPTLYCQNRTSMLKQHYESVFFTCVKPDR